MDNFKDMSVKNKYKQLPKYSRTTEEIIPFWMHGSREDKMSASSEK
jgi:hypothetical protein